MFTRQELRTWLQYAGAALAAFLTGSMVYVVPLLMDPTEPPISWRVVIGSGLSAVLSAYLGSRITRPGKEGVSAQVNALMGAGVKPDDMIVTPRPGVIPLRAAVAANPKMQPIVDSMKGDDGDSGRAA